TALAARLAIVEDLDPKAAVVGAGAQNGDAARLAAVADQADLAGAERRRQARGQAVLELGDVPVLSVASELELAVQGAAFVLFDRRDDGFLALKYAEVREGDAEQPAAKAVRADDPD